QRLVPFEIDVEIRVGEECRTIAAHGEMQGDRYFVGVNGLPARIVDAVLRPERTRFFDRDIGLVPRKVGGNAHLLEPWLAALPSKPVEIIRRRGQRVRGVADELAG